ncbi:MAG TPA: hypothetical protein VFV33_10100 [Gemmatimonadaceae bacterium]|nr:hypothetical protein [Gemmatimonadaceae bacterium]
MALGSRVAVAQGQRAAPGAQPPPPLVVTYETVTQGDSARGTSRRERSASTPMPGDQLRYRLRFTNTTAGPVRNVRFDNPVPRGLSFVPASARADREGVAVEFSIDGGRTFSAAPSIEVVENGQRTRKPAPASMITDIRWSVSGGLAVGEQVVAEYRAAVGIMAPYKGNEVP